MIQLHLLIQLHLPALACAHGDLSDPAFRQVPDAEAKIEELFNFWDQINTEDIGVVEKVQIGTAAPAYNGGRFSFRFEEPVHRFQNMVIDKMLGGEDAEIRFRIPDGDAGYDALANQSGPFVHN